MSNAIKHLYVMLTGDPWVLIYSDGMSAVRDLSGCYIKSIKHDVARVDPYNRGIIITQGGGGGTNYFSLSLILSLIPDVTGRRVGIASLRYLRNLIIGTIFDNDAATWSNSCVTGRAPYGLPWGCLGTRIAVVAGGRYVEILCWGERPRLFGLCGILVKERHDEQRQHQKIMHGKRSHEVIKTSVPRSFD
jgi:hypothetical protein